MGLVKPYDVAYSVHMTVTLGDKQTARMLFDKMNPHLFSGNYPRSPKGFKRIGEGCYRTVFLDKANDIVYKVGSASANTDEAWNSAKLRKELRINKGKLPFRLYVPRTRTFVMGKDDRGVNAIVAVQEFAKGATPTNCGRYYGKNCTCKQPICYDDVINEVGHWGELCDMHPWNILHNRKTDVYWLIDIAS